MFGFEKTKKTLEYDKIIEYIAAKCVSETGGTRLKNSAPVLEADTLQNILFQVKEMREVFLADGGFPIWDYYDIRILLNKIEPEESFLEIADFLKVQNFLEVIAEVHSFYNKVKEKYPYLGNIINRLKQKDKLLTQIKFTVEPSGKIYDNASPELKAIRKDIAKVNDDIHQRLERIVRKKAEYLQEDYLTLRDGRLVIPVREFSVTKIPGIVHGQSSTGATYFVEPMPVVELNNQMQKLLSAERKEIVKILKRLSKLLRDEQSDLIIDFDLLNELDVLQAKAKYANEVKAILPEINDSFYWRLKSAKHPLLLKMHPDSTVPLNLTAGKDNNELIISGPNAGGKTVALKTIGLLQLLFQSGFHIPAAEGTLMPICRQVFTIIGDKQSIEQDLSTFSSHINALNEIVNNIENEGLVLIDEIGSGTEPSGGAALSISFLEKINKKGIVSIVTTHQNQLKAFASETEGIENAAMQFDNENLTPLFTMEQGIPGSSYTYDICRRLGLDESILKRAIAVSGKETFKLDALLTDVTQKSLKYQELSNQLSIKESELNGLIQLYKDRNEIFKTKRKQLEKEAVEQAQEILNNVNREIETAIREIKESQADKEVVKKARQRLEDQRKLLHQKTEEKETISTTDIAGLSKGQRVRSVQYGIKGVISKIFKSKDEVEIEKDGLKITVSILDIELLDEFGKVISQDVNRKTTSDQMFTASAETNISNELNLRGLTVDEAIRKVESYLDSAVMSSWDEVRLVHGKGTGALREAVHKYLSGLKTIKEYRLGKWGEGDSGVTVVLLK
jgi:DNA mismatch repair protein MutS2